MGALLGVGLSYYWIKRRRAAASRNANKNDGPAAAAASKEDGPSPTPGAIEAAEAHSSHIANATNEPIVS